MAKAGRTITLLGGEVVHAGPVRGPDIVALVKAARLCVADELTDERIAAELGVSRRTLARWKHFPLFQDLVAVEREKALARRDDGGTT